MTSIEMLMLNGVWIPFKATLSSTSSSPSGFPDATTTGIPVGTVLTPSTGITASTPGQVVQNLDITGGGYVRVLASNVTVKNCRITGVDENGSNGIEIDGGNVIVQDCEISHFENGIAYSNFAAYRVHMHHLTGDGIKLGSNVTLQDSYIHDFIGSDDAHHDGAQLQDGSVNMVIRHNTISIPYIPYIKNGVEYQTGNGAIYVQPIFGPNAAGPLLIENNYLIGGGYTVYIIGGSSAGGYTQSGITVQNNIIGYEHQYAPSFIDTPVTWINNTYPDGTPIT